MCLHVSVGEYAGVDVIVTACFPTWLRILGLVVFLWLQDREDEGFTGLNLSGLKVLLLPSLSSVFFSSFYILEILLLFCYDHIFFFL